MKKIATFPFLFALVFCGSNKDTVKNEDKTNKELQTILKEKSQCPEDGVCTIEILKNKRLLVKNDEFNNFYFQTEDSNDFSIIKFQYKRNTDERVQDANYSEQILFEIKNSDTNLQLANSELQNVKMLFGRLCFCKGQTGYYKITQGHLSLKKAQEEYQVDLDFSISEVPQIIKSISNSVK